MRTKENDWPAWYKLGFIEDPLGISLSIHKDWFPYLCEEDQRHPHFFRLVAEEPFKLEAFVPPAAGDWGYAECMKYRGEIGNFMHWDIPLEGVVSGKYLLENIAATLHGIFLILSSMNKGMADKKWTSDELQLVQVSTHLSVGHYGGHIGAEFSMELTKWLRTFGHEERRLPYVSDAMLKVDAALQGGKARSHSIWVLYREPCWINIEVPGNSAGLDPKDYYDEGKGYNLSPHNTDNAIQQLLILVGIAKLCDWYRESARA